MRLNIRGQPTRFCSESSIPCDPFFTHGKVKLEMTTSQMPKLQVHQRGQISDFRVGMRDLDACPASRCPWDLQISRCQWLPSRCNAMSSTLLAHNLFAYQTSSSDQRRVTRAFARNGYSVRLLKVLLCLIVLLSAQLQDGLHAFLGQHSSYGARSAQSLRAATALVSCAGIDLPYQVHKVLCLGDECTTQRGYACYR